jgi:hypothetical protein
VRLVESDVDLEREDVPEVARPPRPEHRKAYVSLPLTIAVLVAIVAAVYAFVPKRDNEVVDQLVRHHRAPGTYDLEHPSAGELTAWTLGVLARPVPWPTGPGLEIVGVRRLVLLKRPAAAVRYRIGSGEVTLVAMVPWDVPARRVVVDDGDLHAVWWRERPWTMIAVGPRTGADVWRAALGVP